MTQAPLLSRRKFLSASALVVSFSLAPRARAQLAGGGETDAGLPIIAPDLKGDLQATPWLDSWIRIDANGAITVFTGKAELGQGIKTALIQVAAEELDVKSDMITLITADTFRTPDEGVTAASHSMQDSGTAILNAAANVRMLLTQAAAKNWNVAPQSVTTDGTGVLIGPAGQSTGYGPIAASLALHVKAIPNVPLRDPKQFRTIGTSLPRVDIPAKLTGGEIFIQDMRLPGMLHARVVRGPSVGTQLKNLDIAAVEAMPGVVKVVQSGSFTAVVAEQEWTAIMALRHFEEASFVRTAPALPTTDLVTMLKSLPMIDIIVLDTHDTTAPPTLTVKARYTRPYLSHGSIGPSCALAWFQDDLMTVWTHSQATFDVHRVAAQLLQMPPEKVHAIHVQGAGCYGQNGADDVAAEAAFIAKAVPGRPIRLQWMREQEFGWEPLGCGMVTEVEAALDAQNRIVTWNCEVWSNSFNNRPVGAGGVLVGNEIPNPFPVPESQLLPMPDGDGDRNADPLYTWPNMHVIYHFLPKRPIRVSAMRSFGAHLNVFALESMLDELAKGASVDPLALRLTHMQDQRARDVMQAAAERFGWADRARNTPLRGCGMGFARYKNQCAYCVVILEVEVEPDTGHIAVRRAVAAVDCGQPVNPDGIRNQVEGGIIQSISWTSREAATFDAQHRTSFDWSSYPILRFSDIPYEIDVHVMDRPGQPFLGMAECAQGPAAAALANALADATGVRIRDMPLSPERVKATLGA